MLRELVEYYECIIQQPDSDFVPDGFMKVPNVAYKIVLTQDGRLKDILPNTHIDTSGKKTKEVGYDEIFPFRYSVPGIAAETIECRGKYLFGLDWDPYLKEKVAIGLFPYVQANLMAKYIRGEISEYPALIWG